LALCPSSDEGSIIVTSEHACVSMLTVTLTVISAVVQATELPFPTFRSKAYVEIIAGGIHRRSRSVKRKEERWDFKTDM
jgi:hypothetical protein